MFNSAVVMFLVVPLWWDERSNVVGCHVDVPSRDQPGLDWAGVLHVVHYENNTMVKSGCRGVRAKVPLISRTATVGHTPDANCGSGLKSFACLCSGPSLVMHI